MTLRFKKLAELLTSLLLFLLPKLRFSKGESLANKFSSNWLSRLWQSRSDEFFIHEEAVEDHNDFLGCRRFQDELINLIELTLSDH